MGSGRRDRRSYGGSLVLTNADYVARQEARESNARTYARRLRIAITRAKGVHVWDADGKRYYDCLAAAGTLALGHNHEFVREALIKAIEDELPMQTLDLTTPAKDAFVEELFRNLPEEFRRHARIQFCGPSGADAIEAALKLVKTATGRHGMLAFHGAYHGMTHGALSMTGSLGPKAAIAGLMPGVQFMPYPHHYRCPFGVGGTDSSKLSATLVETLLEDPESGVIPAGLIAELVQGEGGVIPAPDAWTREIRRITAAHDIPMIVDEVQTGGGRTGRMWAFEHSGISPDVVVMSKAIGGGLPLSVVVYHEKLDRWQPGAHAGTFRGNQLAMAAGTATLAFIREQNLASHAAEMGRRLVDHLNGIQHPWIGHIRGRGLMIGVEIVDPTKPAVRGAYPADPVRARALQQECLKRGLILELGGRHGAVVRFLAPLIVTAADVDAIAAIFVDAAAAA